MHSSRGAICYTYKDLMALPNSLLKNIVYLYPTKFCADQNIKIGGTGFLVGVESATRKKPYLYVVTNLHVLEGIKGCGGKECVIRYNTEATDVPDTITTNIKDWHNLPSKDDVAVYPLEPDESWNHDYVGEDQFVREEYIHDQIFSETSPMPIVIKKTADYIEKLHQIGIGDETVTVGRYIKHAGKNYNYPIARHGNIAMLPFEKVIQSDRGGREQESFLVETHSVGGMSGSPVFVRAWVDYQYPKDPSKNDFDEVLLLLGIDWGHFDFSPDKLEGTTKEFKLTSGMMCVVPTWQLSELLHTKELTMQREEADKDEAKRKDEGASSDSVTREEFEQTLKKVARKINPSESDRPKPKTSAENRSDEST